MFIIMLLQNPQELMVDGLHGNVDHVVRHVVMEDISLLEHVTVPNFHVVQQRKSL